MSVQYDEYLKRHVKNVKKAAEWMLEELPAANELSDEDIEDIRFLVDVHDSTKNCDIEYKAYDKHFYGGGNNEDEFNLAWLHHISTNPHHWQHWVIPQDDGGSIAVEMPKTYVWEMIADWWSFSWASGDRSEIFKWYDEHKEIMILHERTREYVERLIEEIRENIGDDSDDAKIVSWQYTMKIDPFVIGSNKEGATKIVEEAAEAFSAWEDVCECGYYDGELCNECEFIGDCWIRSHFASELADVVQAACNMARRYEIDMESEMRKCEKRNRDRGRY